MLHSSLAHNFDLNDDTAEKDQASIACGCSQSGGPVGIIVTPLIPNEHRQRA